MIERGKFIVLEGSDGTGKSLQTMRLAEHLTEQKIPFIQTREPGGTEWGDQIRAVLVRRGQAAPVDEMAELLIFYSARAQLLKEVIVPARASGTHVLADRFELSTLVYQGWGRGLGRDLIDFLSYQVTQRHNCIPDLYLVLQAPIDICEGRLLGGRVQDNRLFEETEFQRVVHGGYARIAELSESGSLELAPSVEVIDANRDPNLVQADIRKHVMGLLRREK